MDKACSSSASSSDNPTSTMTGSGGGGNGQTPVTSTNTYRGTTATESAAPGANIAGGTIPDTRNFVGMGLLGLAGAVLVFW